MGETAKKYISYCLLFVTIFSLSILLPEEPAYASGEFSCTDANGAPYAYHMEFSGDDVTVYQWDVTNGEYDTAETFDFGPLTGTTDQINGFTMDLVGNMYAIYQPTSGSKRLIKLNYNASGAGTITDLGAISNSSSGDVNAGTFIQHGGNDYIVFSKGMGDGGLYYAQLSNSTTMSASGTWSQNSTFNDGANKKQAKDFAWIRDGLEISGTTYNLMGVDLKNDAVILGIWAGPGTAVELVDYDIDSKPSGWNSADTVGAMYGFGGTTIYASNNQEGEMGEVTWDGSAFDITGKGDSEASSNNDGAACHGGDPTVDFVPAVTAAQGSCSSGNKPVNVTLTNTNSEITANFVVTYTLDGGGSQTLTSGVNVTAGATNTDYSVPAQPNGTAVVVSWYAQNTDADYRSPSSGTSTVSTVTINTSDCPTGTVATGLGSCSNGSATSTITLTATNSTMYFDVQYSTNGGSSWTDLKDGESVAAGTPETYSTPAQADGTTVSWQYRTDTSNPSSGSFTSATSRTVDCNPESTVSQSLGSCSTGSKTSTISLRNDESSATAYYLVEYSLDGGNSYSEKVASQSVSAGQTNTSHSHSVADGQTIIWRIKDSFTDGNFTNQNWETLSASDEVDCPYINPGASQSLAGSCSGTSKTSTLTLTNASPSNTNAYYQVRYSTDGGSSWTEKAANQSVSSGASAQLTQSVSDGSAIIWSYRSSSTSGSFSGDYTNLSASATVDCDIDPGASQSLGSCSSGSKTSEVTLTNANGELTAYYQVRYSTDGGSSWTEKAANQSVSSGGSEELTQSVPHGSTIIWSYRASSTSGSFSGNYTDLSASDAVDCPIIDTGASQSLGSCASQAKTSTLTLTNSSSANTTAYFQVRYSTDGGSSWTEKAANEDVATNGSAQLTQSVPDGSTIIWSYRSSSTSGSFSGNYTNLSASDEVDCPSTTPTTAAPTTTTTTTTTTLPPDIFRPVINNKRICNSDTSVGGGDYLFQFNHEDATVDATLKLIVYIDQQKVSESSYSIPAGSNVSIITVSNVEEDARYKLKFEVSNDYTNQVTVGKFTKKTNCVKGDTPTTTIPVITTTTTIPEILTTEDVDTYVTTTTTTIPDEIGDPLTSEEGNDYFVWDYEEDLYFTDGNFIVQYVYEETSVTLADTGYNYLKSIYYALASLFSGFFFVLIKRLRDVKQLNKFIHSHKLKDQADSIKHKIEALLNKSVELDYKLSNQVKINIFNVGRHIKNITSTQLQLESLRNSLIRNEFRYDDLSNNSLFTKYLSNKYEHSIKKSISRRLSDSKEYFEYIFSNNSLTQQLFKDKDRGSSITIIDFQKSLSSKLSLTISSTFFAAALMISTYSIYETYITNYYQVAAQEKLESKYLNGISHYKENYISEVDMSQSVNTVSDERLSLRNSFFEFFVGGNNNEIDQSDPEAFAVLKVPSINLKQYVTEGTNTENLQIGPGRYIGSNYPDSFNSNIAIAGHRTTYGAPFENIDNLDMGDEIHLTYNNKNYVYIVDEMHVVDVGTGEYYLYNRGQARITLTTCHPKYSAKQRLIVTGVLKTIEHY